MSVFDDAHERQVEAFSVFLLSKNWQVCVKSIRRRGGVVMSKESEEFLRKMLGFLPSTEVEYRESIAYHDGEVLDTIIIELIFMPKIIELLIEDRNIKLLETIFKYFEEVSKSKDFHLKSIFKTTALEILGNNESILRTAQKYMGAKTMKLQIEADIALGRIR